jgi:hypothetical protein
MPGHRYAMFQAEYRNAMYLRGVSQAIAAKSSPRGTRVSRVIVFSACGHTRMLCASAGAAIIIREKVVAAPTGRRN